MMYLSHIYGKGKSKYKFFSNMVYCMREMWRWKKIACIGVLFSFLPFIVGNYLGALLPSWVVRDLEEKADITVLLLHIFLLSLFMWIGNTLYGGLDTYFQNVVYGYIHHFRRKFHRKIMDMDYDILEGEDCRQVVGNVTAAVKYGRGLYEMPVFLSGIIVNGVMVVFYAVLICRIAWWLAAVIMVTVMIDLEILEVARRKHKQYYGETSRYSRRTDYINHQAEDAAAGKDIRMYRLGDFFLKKYGESLDGLEGIFNKIHQWYLVRSISDAVLMVFRSGIAYVFLLISLVRGEMTAAEFVYYIGLVSSFAFYFEELVRILMILNSTNASVSFIREFLEWPDGWNRGEGVGKEIMESIRKAPVKLELRHVSFTYPGSEKETLSDINLLIRPGEKLALLGLNGAGKTTLVKLICGFYHPTEGEIFLNNIPVGQFSREEYYSLLSVLFQDYTLLPMTLDENLTGREEGKEDRQQLDWALRMSGFWERYHRLPEKGRSKMVREVQKDSVDFSGGEKQKLLFARALYRKAPLVILDEPTAALDPIAENELYLHYGEAMENTTSIYISHRLSSTRFCDRIVLLENGRLVEEGTHEELMKGDTRYAQLYRVQSQYYVTNPDSPNSPERNMVESGGTQSIGRREAGHEEK